MSYSRDGKNAYGELCEWIGCGWNQATCDTHHIDYEVHQEIENNIRAYYMMEDDEHFEYMLDLARRLGYGEYNQKTRQLPKNDSISNLAILCPNHHRYVHHHNLSMDLLEYIPRRKKPQGN
jgi:hypothetical protein